MTFIINTTFKATASLLSNHTIDAEQVTENTTGSSYGEIAFLASCAFIGLRLAYLFVQDCVQHARSHRFNEAVRVGNIDLVKKGIKGGVNFDCGEMTPLQMAATHNRYEIAEELLKMKAEIDGTTFIKLKTPLQIAAERGHNATLNILIKGGAGLNSRGSRCYGAKEGLTSLQLASKNGHYAAASLLLDAEADIDAQGHESGEAPLQLAAKKEHYNVARLLIDRGAELNFLDKSDNTVIMSMFRKGQDDMVHSLLFARADLNYESSMVHVDHPSTVLQMAAAQGKTKMVQELLDGGAWVDFGRIITPLGWAAFNGHTQTAKLLLENRADVEHESQVGYTPLSLAVKSRNLETLDLILGAVSDINCQNKYGKTALHVASGIGRAEVVQTLLRYGGDSSLRCASGKTALQYAISKKHEGVINAFMEHQLYPMNFKQEVSRNLAPIFPQPLQDIILGYSQVSNDQFKRYLKGIYA